MSTLQEELEDAMEKLDEAIEWNYGHIKNDPRANYWLERSDELQKLREEEILQEMEKAFNKESK